MEGLKCCLFQKEDTGTPQRAKFTNLLATKLSDVFLTDQENFSQISVNFVQIFSQNPK